MPVPSAQTKHIDKNMLDLEIDRFAQLDKPSLAALNRVGTVAQIQSSIEDKKLARFRRKGVKMDKEALKTERHYSSRMALQLTRAGYEKPSKRCEAHAIVSGQHKLAGQMRAVLAWCKVRVDDHHNGCWLPAFKDDKPFMPTFLSNAVPHRNIHTNAYYRWMGGQISPAKINSLEDLIKKLENIRFRLQSGSIPDHIYS